MVNFPDKLNTYLSEVNKYILIYFSVGIIFENLYVQCSQFFPYTSDVKSIISLFSPHLRSRRGNKRQQLLMIAFLIIFGLVTLLVIFHYFGRSGEDEYQGDPMFESYYQMVQSR